jgi:hypothetical protein
MISLERGDAGLADGEEHLQEELIFLRHRDNATPTLTFARGLIESKLARPAASQLLGNLSSG